MPSVSDDRGVTVGVGRSFGELTVFPILTNDQEDLGAFVTLEQAIASKDAEVREADASGRVNTLVIANKGDKSVFVLAGTLVKGGKQDRQIGQDFSVAPHETVPVDAYCVEPHRWNGTRAGVPTQNRFGTAKTLANSSIRAAGQYKKNQLEVWEKVGQVNAQNHKASPTGTLNATLDDAEITQQRAVLARQISDYLAQQPSARDIVGLAYAVEGKVRGVRWFANHDLFALYGEVLSNTAALESITAVHGAAGTLRVNYVPPTPEMVTEFVDEIDHATTVEERPTQGENVNTYKESKSGYGSSAALKPNTGKAPPKAGKKSAISRDFTAK
jgi:hypothetical protein